MQGYLKDKGQLIGNIQYQLALQPLSCVKQDLQYQVPSHHAQLPQLHGAFEGIGLAKSDFIVEPISLDRSLAGRQILVPLGERSKSALTTSTRCLCPAERVAVTIGEPTPSGDNGW